jgi:hypothetical protein
LPAGNFAGQLVVAILLILLLLLAIALGPVERAGASRYVVAQCGWKAGHDAGWLETSADKFNRSSWCGVPAGSDPWDGIHLSSGIRGSTAAVTGSRFARWRWSAPAGTGIVTVSGDRWHVLRDRFQHRLGSVATGGGFVPFVSFSNTDVERREFSTAFSPHAAAFESRLICALPPERACSVSGNSLAGLRALTFTIDDPVRPTSTFKGGFRSGSWLRGNQKVVFTGSDVGSGIRLSETIVDGAVRAGTDHRCESAKIAGQLRGTKMQPCRTAVEGSHVIDTTRLSDGPHAIIHCTTDFAAMRGCTSPGTLRTDNTAPSAPRSLEVAGGSDWRRSNTFALSWTNPDQGAAAPIAGLRYRVRGGSFDSGVVAVAGAGDETLAGLQVPTAGEYQLALWLSDAADNENPVALAEAPLRFDDVDPEAFVLRPDSRTPELLRATVFDEHSGPAGGVISFRRRGSEAWRDLPTRFEGEAKRAELTADFPSDDLPPGRYAIRVRVRDSAGNEAVSDRRPDGTRLVLKAPLTEQTRLDVRLAGRGEGGRAIKVPFGSGARLLGRLTAEGGRGVQGRQVAVVQRPGYGARSRASIRLLRTGPGGRFAMRLPAGTSRQIKVSFAGDRQYSESSTAPLRLGVIGSINFSARPGRLRTGQTVSFSGRVRAGEARHPSRGNLVAIRYLERDSGQWRPVLVTRTDRLGRYRVSYRFRYITGVARIQLRATLLPSQGFPYLPADSPVRSVRVQG